MSADTVSLDQARTELDAIMHDEASFESKAERALELGTEFLGVEHGHVTKVLPDTDYWEAIVSTDPSDGRFPTGRVADLQKTYCRRTINQKSPIALHDASHQEWSEDPAFEEHGLACYHGSTISIDDETFGTVCFVSPDARDPFTDAESLFAELIASHLEQELERRRHAADMTRQSNLVNVLNRVLRHNLRNGMAIIRGHAEGLREGKARQRADPETIVDRADTLIQLSETARKLESVVVEETELREFDLPVLLEQVRNRVQQEYPTATIDVQCPDKLSVVVRPSLRTALDELVENAAKHTGENPTVRVTVDPTPNEVMIEIIDDGPGLASIERKVLSEGVETSLEHGEGLGLWLAYWVVSGHDGDISVDVTDTGTQMRLTLPREMAAPAMGGVGGEVATIERVQDQFRAVFNEAFDAMVLLNDDGVIVDTNRSSEDLFGIGTGDLLGQPIGRFVGAGESCALVDGVTHVDEYEFGTVPIEQADGTERIVEFTLTTDIVPNQHLCVLRDVTKEVRRKRDLERYEQVLETVNDGAWVLDEEKRITLVNQELLNVLGTSRETLVGTPVAAFEDLFVDPEDFHRYDMVIEDLLAGRAARGELDVVLDLPDGEMETNIRLAPLAGDDGPTGVVGIASDITDRRQRERELTKLEQALETLLANVPVVFWSTDEDGVFTRSEGSALASLGLEPGEVVGDSVFDIYDGHPQACELTRRALDGESIAATLQVGDTVLDTWHQPLLDSDDEVIGTVGLAYDITDRDAVRTNDRTLFAAVRSGEVYDSERYPPSP